MDQRAASGRPFVFSKAPSALIGQPRRGLACGQVMQDESTADMIYPVAAIIEHISRHVQLWPGDLILTGSPAGNGTHYNRYISDKDVIEGEIAGLGVQRSPCVAEHAT